MSSSSWLRLLPRRSVTFILPSTFPSTTYFIRQFFRKMWPIQPALLPLMLIGYSSHHSLPHIIPFIILYSIYRVHINYRRISLHHNLSRKYRKIVKFVLITHSERNIWNGPIVDTAISWEKRKSVFEGNGCLTFCTWPPRSPDLTVCDFFLRGFVKDNVYVPPLPKTLPELRGRINTATGNVAQDMLERVWREWEYRLDICRVTRGAHVECV